MYRQGGDSFALHVDKVYCRNVHDAIRTMQCIIVTLIWCDANSLLLNPFANAFLNWHHEKKTPICPFAMLIAKSSNRKQEKVPK